MADEFTSTQPIYMQIVERVCKRIVRGELLPGDKLPSVRDMAVESGVNPNTVQRVYAELERMTVVETKRGQGTFVTQDEIRLMELRRELRHQHISSFVRDMTDMGFGNEEIVEGVQTYIDCLGNERTY